MEMIRSGQGSDQENSTEDKEGLLCIHGSSISVFQYSCMFRQYVLGFELTTWRPAEGGGLAFAAAPSAAPGVWAPSAAPGVWAMGDPFEEATYMHEELDG